mmetsp:Transcript_80924/g.179853  ORF Transcript_80924/g.179853 Transcript_80924/m.179853 type:complete len:387 (+) Transcript_80924:447-1607(+)
MVDLLGLRALCDVPHPHGHVGGGGGYKVKVFGEVKLRDGRVVCVEAAHLGAVVCTPEDEIAAVVRAHHLLVPTTPTNLRRGAWQLSDAKELLDRGAFAIEAPERECRRLTPKAVVARHKALRGGRVLLGGFCWTSIHAGPLHKSYDPWQLHTCDLLRSPGFPDDHAAISSARHKPPGVGGRAATPDGAAVASIGAQALALRGAPNADNLVLTAREEKVAIAIPRNERDRPLVAVQGVLFSLGLPHGYLGGRAGGRSCLRCGAAGLLLRRLRRRLTPQDLRRALAFLAHLPHLLRLGHLIDDAVKTAAGGRRDFRNHAPLPHRVCVGVSCGLEPCNTSAAGSARLCLHGTLSPRHRLILLLYIVLLVFVLFRSPPHQPSEEEDQERT